MESNHHNHNQIGNLNMNKKLAFVALAFAAPIMAFSMTELAGPAHADTNDTAFLDILHSHGIYNDNGNSALIAVGHQVCDKLDINGSAIETSEWLYGISKMTDLSSAAYFVGASVGAYCPEYSYLGN